MQHQPSHNHSCTHCACNNPILKLLKEELFSQENFDKLPASKANVSIEKPEALMFSGGTIRPMIGGAVETVPAIGFADGYVVTVGTENEVREFMNLNYSGYTARTLATGQTLLPGLIEPHVHLVPTAMLMSWLDLGGFQEQNLRPGYSIDWVSQQINAYLPNIKGKQWILGSGLDPALMPFEGTNLLTITNQVLDNIVADVPLMIIAASMHTLYVNTMALHEIYEKNKGEIKFREKYLTFKDYQDKTQGQLQQADGMDPALKTMPKEQMLTMFTDSLTHLHTIFETANERGTTFMYDAGMSTPLHRILDVYTATHSRKVRIGAANVIATREEANALPIFSAPTEYSDVFISHIKVITDGSNQGLTGFQSEPYLCYAKDPVGLFNFGIEKNPTNVPPELRELLKIIMTEKQWPLMIHANGDKAIDFVMEIFEQFITDPGAGVRHRIEHCSLTTSDQLTIMRQLQVSPSFLIGHVGYWGYAFQDIIFGPDKVAMLDLCKSAIEAGMKITLHSDNSVSPLGPLRMMEQAITRIMEADPALGVLNQSECITREQALRAITHDAAWQCYADAWTGSLEKGKFADFVILKQDPLTIQQPYMDMRYIEVLETWVGGLKVYNNVAFEEMSMA
jgi:predicted amidohydrolase YtcJ